MRNALIVATATALLGLGAAVMTQEQDPPQDPSRNTDPRFTTTTRPVIMGATHAVSSMKPQATDAAMRILDAGGNAFDAAVAGQAVLALADPAMNGIGADAEILVYDAKAKKVISINASGPAPKLATADWYRKNANGRIPSDTSLLAATVPGLIDAWHTLLDRWGTMTFAQVLQPAIDLAERGLPLTFGLATAMNNSAKLRRYPTSVKLYQPATPWKEGDIFKNPDAGRLLRKLVEAEQAAASKGRKAGLLAARDRFYKGDIAKTMAAFAEEQGALFRYDDFATYAVQIEEPVSVNYRGYDVYKNPSASQGPTELFALNILEGYDLKKMGLNSAEYIHVTAEATKLAMGDREKFLGDWNFIKIPYQGLLSKSYAAERRKLIDPNKASMELRPGDPSMFMKAGDYVDADYRWSVTREGDAHHEGDTSYIAVVDKDRNMVGFEPSLHSVFGTGVVIADLGIIFNCRGDYFTLEPGKPYTLGEPGKRPRSTLQSTLVMKDGQPFMLIGSPGGDDQIMRTMQTLLNVIDFNLNVQEAIEAARWSSRAFPASSTPFTMRPGDLQVESRIPADVQAALKAKGHVLSVSRPWSLGSNGALLIDPRTGLIKAAADPRVDAYAQAR
jgi:gamma-glutamyltranspeptidase/glutathione hydrolase